MTQNGDEKQRSAAARTLANDGTFRSLRAGPRLASNLSKIQPLAFVAAGTKQRTIFSAQNQTRLPGDIVRTEGGASNGDPAVEEAYDGLGATYDFFWEIFGRNSIDDEGLPLNATVHFGEEYNNAFWDGQRMVFGDGDEDLFNRFTVSLDIIAHELAHGVTEDESQLIYESQSGALNESMSDVLGSLVKQRVLEQTADEADWLIGADLFTDKVEGANGQPAALRSMKDPGTAYDDPLLGKDPQPKHMDDFVDTFSDNGGVHINSGIPNHAFYLFAVSMGGHAWEKAGRVWYETLRDPRLKPNAKFHRFAQLTVDNVSRLYLNDQAVTTTLRDAWERVGIKVP